MNEFSITTRGENLDRLTRATWDILVIGGGITGAGAARDAVLRGLRVALVEQEDFACGTSSRTGRMVHGGLRYLEEGHLRLVVESLAERAVLHRTAPRLVTAHPFMIPVRGSLLAMARMAVGLALYQGLALSRTVGPARLVSARRARDLEPVVAPDRLAGGAIYWDCLTDDARLVLALILDAHNRGAVATNHAPAVGLLKAGNRVAGAAVRDALTGRTLEVRARVVINATGPWSERTSAMSGRYALRLRQTRGSHIVVPRSRLETHQAIIFSSPHDRRHLYLVPWAQQSIVGTTETDYVGDPDAVCATAEDVDYLLEALRAAFPGAGVGPRDVLSTFAGVRPLLNRPGLGAYRVPRDYRIVENPPGLVSVAGGKLTTFRRMAQDTVDLAAKSIGGGATRQRCRTADVPVEPHCEEASPLAEGVMCAAKHEMAVTLCDCLIRRLRLIHELPDQGLSMAPEAARLMAPLLDWTETQQQAQIEEYMAAVAQTRRWQAGPRQDDADGS